MIERLWTGITSYGNADRYIAHLEDDTFPKLKKLAGYVSSKILKRALANGNIEFMIVTRWQSIDSISAFAGDDITTAVIPVTAQSLLLSYDDFVSHYEVYSESTKTN